MIVRKKEKSPLFTSETGQGRAKVGLGPNCWAVLQGRTTGLPGTDSLKVPEAATYDGNCGKVESAVRDLPARGAYRTQGSCCPGRQWNSGSLPIHRSKRRGVPQQLGLR